MSFFPCSELRGRHISDSTLTACANGGSYHSLLNVLVKILGLWDGARLFVCQRRADKTISFVCGFSFTVDASWFKDILLHQMSNQPVYLAENKGKRGEKKEIYIFSVGSATSFGLPLTEGRWWEQATRVGRGVEAHLLAGTSSFIS